MPPAFAVVTLTILITLGYLAVCAVSPFAPCRTCHGLGFHLATTRTGKPARGRPCRRCHGHGCRIRTGRRLINLCLRARHDRTR